MRNNVLSYGLAIFGYLIATTAALPSSACGYHGSLGDGFSQFHPGSIDVAIAIREAADENVLSREFVAPRVADLFALQRASQRLDRLRQALQRVMADKPVPRSFSLLLVESSMWNRYVIRDDGVALSIHTDAPSAGEAVVVTGSTVLAAISSGQLSFEEAMQRRLILIDAPPELRDAITKGFGQSSTKS